MMMVWNDAMLTVLDNHEQVQQRGGHHKRQLPRAMWRKIEVWLNFYYFFKAKETDCIPAEKYLLRMKILN